MSSSPAPASPSATTAARSGLPTLLRTYLPGVALAVGVGVASAIVSRWTPGLSPLIWAILIGGLLANTLRLPAVLQPGITFSAKQVLRLAVGLLGIRLSLGQVMDVGAVGIGVVLFAVVATFFFTTWIGKRLGLSRTLSTVLAAGTSICGASAIVAVAGVTDAKEEETAIGVGAITLFGTLVMFLFPFVGQLLGLSPEAFGLWAGAAIHEVAQVIAAGFAFDAASSTGSSIELATVVKLGRVLMLAPVAVVLAHTHRASRAAGAAKVSPIPWFVALFIVTMLLRSTGVLPMEVVDQAIRFDGILLAVSMAGLGLDLRWAKVKAAGVAPLYAVLLGTLFIGLSTLALVTLLT